jgi:hypothetical protein
MFRYQVYACLGTKSRMFGYQPSEFLRMFRYRRARKPALAVLFRPFSCSYYSCIPVFTSL